MNFISKIFLSLISTTFIVSAVDVRQEVDDSAFQSFVAQSASILYKRINHSINEDGSRKFRYPKSPEESLSTPSIHWNYFPQNSMQVGTFRIKLELPASFALPELHKPSFALCDLLDKGGIFECAFISSFVTQLIILEFYDNALFDRIHQENNIVLTIPSKKTIGLDEVNKTAPSTPGEFGYISNVARYRDLHPNGFSAGQNIFCVAINETGSPLYLGFGEFFNTPRTEQEIIEELYKDTMLSMTENNNTKDIYESYKNRNVWDIDRARAQISFPAYRLGLVA